jgi:hypothetical protein
MTQTPLRLVFDRGPLSAQPHAIDVPSSTTTLHIHLHLGSAGADQGPLPVVDRRPIQASGRSGRRLTRPLLLGVAAVAMVVGAYDFGARIGEGHARATLARIQAGPSDPSRLALDAAQPQKAGVAAPVSSELPPSIRQQLAQPPTVTVPPGTANPVGSPDPFGLQH